ncbi:MAG: replicative DNA helicase, partial [candidate division WOR-3 bacterium]|nr:replicative DNA helicase [candidate division WOR-3 bacterium]MDW7988165.1 DnaB-like helicase N-terminal domain-containing protein [candidate division WOR-3 bacterium]
MPEAKLPPHDLVAEQAVLGAMLLETRSIAVALQYLSEDSFYLNQHRIIFSTILELYNQSVNVDIVTVSSELEKQKKLTQIGGIEYLSSLTTLLPTTANLEDYCRIVLEKA